MTTLSNDAPDRLSILQASILASPNYLIISTDTEGMVTTFNVAAERVLGYSAAEIVGRATPALWHDPEEIATRAAALTLELETPVSTGFDVFVAKARLTGNADENEWTLTRKDGSRFPGMLSVTCLYDKNGAVNGYLGILHDITAQKLAQASLRARDERLRKLTAQVPGMLYQFLRRPDGSSCFPYASEGICNIYRVSPEEVVTDASAVFAVLHPDDMAEIVASIEHSSTTQTLWSLDYRVKFADATVRWLHGQAVPELLHDGATLWHGFITDITERKHMESELKTSRDELQRSFELAKEAAEERLLMEQKLAETAKLESLGVLAGGIAHDFNNILTGVLGNVTLLQMDVPETSELRQSIDQIEQSALRAAELSKQMLDYSGKGRFVVEDIHINRLIEDTVSLLGVAASRNCEVRYELSPGLPAVAGDQTQLRQVIMNLVINASESIGTAPGIISLRTSLVDSNESVPGSAVAGGHVLIEVSDSGCGMTPEVLKRIFEPFFTTKFTGRGLGLAAVHGIIRGHNGHIDVQSEPGKGTCFRLFLPSAIRLASTAMQALPEPSQQWRSQGHVLVADDEPSVLSIVARILQRAGFTTELVANGEEAVQRYTANPDSYTLVLLDLTMPKMNGEEAFYRIRDIDPAVKIILMSGFSQKEIDDRFEGKALSGFIAKPLDATVLTSVVRQVLAT